MEFNNQTSQYTKNLFDLKHYCNDIKKIFE